MNKNPLVKCCAAIKYEFKRDPADIIVASFIASFVIVCGSIGIMAVIGSIVSLIIS